MSGLTPSDPFVDILVLNWNGWRDTLSCLGALDRLQGIPHRATVIDNGSRDDSVERIRAARPAARLVELERNLGFAGGCNAGIRRALDDGAWAVWLLNNDTVVAGDSLRFLVDRMRSSDDIGVVGSVIRSVASPHVLEAWGGGRVNRYLGTTRRITNPERESPTYIAGTSMLIRREVLEQVGFLDEDYFFYLEDADFCLRATAAGWRLAVAESAVVHHRGGASVNDGRPERSERADRHHVRSSGVFVGKHAGPWVLPAAAVRLAGIIMMRLLRGHIRRLPTLIRLFVSGLRVGRHPSTTQRD
jgi:GT2 family glycosyltransferase